MQITVFGANGKVGSLVVKEALEKNIYVIAFVRSGTKLVESKNLKIVVGDIYNLSDVERAVNGSDAVLSALGSWGTPGKDILTNGMKNIIPAMRKYGVKRIVTITGADASTRDKNEDNNIISRLNKALLMLFAKKIILDGEGHIQLLMQSGLDWTVVRSPVMNQRGETNNYSLTQSKPAPWATINRSSVAQAMMDLLNEKEYVKHAPYIQRTKK